MKKIFLSFLILASSVFATVTDEYPSQKILDSKVPIVDIRTPGEWRESGLLKGSIPIMFFNEQGGYDVEGFLAELSKKVDTTKPFALICRSGSRSKTVSNFLSQEYHYTVINLEGGMLFVKTKDLPVVPYK
ncbi:MAG: rhodanese-like domain-containing protein [Epsilonproteobacteria bacterium]|nr:rhodanese-like domain-containing protein [Campylobacterota bacterium]OIO16450.1 MAG: sulfurtransferase [Helicobacteraceae bacterium CG1_02_36_14]PIP10423.1 MAG: sulfurtransferase [Sulfurimonas sp. CG23_combo_of_CG06-09_8_20_14_all_36_33]PIS27046.1 MAG: rhodanese-like domain-containing protein [Sulfurimonas sp. CG08_land_8_20_14_0_20_36_33]PIU33500.1 MAG: rhodanese-like domain-containing protein [Sulfurimonas sp. CG07_land_8_20_14_0_80_36_56]PIV05745.1 MAG: rhodanese-like domain-containing p